MTAPALVLGFAALGVALAAAVNWAADALPERRRHVRPALWAGDRGSLLLQRHSLVTLACVAGAMLAAVTLPGARALALVLWGAFFLMIAVIDIEHRLVLNRVLLVAAPVALAASVAGAPLAPLPSLSLLGGAVGLAMFLAIALLGRGAMGAGDVKLAAVIGLIAGYPAVLTALLAGVLFGGVAAAVALLRGLGRRSTIPYAPWLALGAMLALAQAAAAAPL